MLFDDCMHHDSDMLRGGIVELQNCNYAQLLEAVQQVAMSLPRCWLADSLLSP